MPPWGIILLMNVLACVGVCSHVEASGWFRGSPVKGGPPLFSPCSLKMGSLPELSVCWFYTSLLATGKSPASSWPTSQHSFITNSSITVIGVHDCDPCLTWVTGIQTKVLMLAHQHAGSLSFLPHTALENLYFTEKWMAVIGTFLSRDLYWER